MPARIRQSSASNLLPIALDRLQPGGEYCIDFSADEAITFRWYQSAAERQVLASSFLALLRFVTKYLRWGGSYATMDEETQTLASTALKGVDPEGIGGAAWEQWWLPRLQSAHL